MREEEGLNGERSGAGARGTPGAGENGADLRAERLDGPPRRSGEGRFCLVFGGDPFLYHQLALRLSLEGFAVTGVGPETVNAGLRREIERAGGTFRGSSVSEVPGEDGALTVLASAEPFQALKWEAEHRVHVYSSPSPVSATTRKTAIITYPWPRLGVLLLDLTEQVVEVLRRPPRALSLRYAAGEGGELRCFGRDQADRAVEAGAEVRPPAATSGVFTTRAYRCGDQVMTTGGVLLPAPTDHSVRVGVGRHFEPYAPARLLARVPSPNLEMRFVQDDRIDFHALRDLQAGEELTRDRRGRRRPAATGAGAAEDAPTRTGLWAPDPAGLLGRPLVPVAGRGWPVPGPE